MPKWMLILSLVTSPLTLSAAGGPATTNTAADQNMKYFQNQLQEQINLQYQLVNQLKDQMARTDQLNIVPTEQRFENAVNMLGVKKTLYANFVNTPSIQSPLVQQALLQIFKKELITTDDLARLQSLVQQERPKYVNQPATTAPAGP